MFLSEPFEKAQNNIILRNKNIIIHTDSTPISAAELSALKKQHSDAHCIAEKETSLSALELPQDICLAGTDELPLREYFSTHTEEENGAAARAKTLLSWSKKMQYCPACGKPLTFCADESAKKCTECGELYFPRIEPCIIVLVKNEDKLLLVRHTYRNQDIFACIAGFIEASENAEHAVIREIKEETGISVKNIVYKGSQSWPFPDQLMLAYTAEYAGGKLHLQAEEIAEAGWFSADDIPEGPRPGSVAYRLIHNLF